ncbi:LamG domain-containing protein [Flavobacterium humi]|uniref:Secreted protein n=1 Tax=Flavobacterium humi TaxID=2562683 RepID=A0A4Z0LA71_9FLAO|nr:hypothetical protein [Flavobacterium humi]TGD58130.1 hypothetical protein E4635_08990 [Flavobacterium humi]
MKWKYLIVFAIGFATNVFAQDNSSIPSTAIPKVGTTTPVPAAEGTPQYSISNPFNPTRFKAPQKFEPISMDKPMQVKPQVSDLKPGLQYEKKLNKPQGETSKPYRGNQFLGDFRTKSESAKIVYRDHEYVDGDMIRVWVNGQLMVDRIELLGDFQKLELGLTKGFNKVEFEALNQGTSGPNTAEFQVYDDQGNLISSNKWNLATGFKASIVIIKE